MTDSFGILLRQLRYKSNLTQQELASRIGYETSNISAWENGRRLPDKQTIVAIGKALLLPREIIESLLITANISIKVEDEILDKVSSLPETTLPVTPALRYTEAVRGLRIQIEDIQNSIESLDSRIESMKSQTPKKDDVSLVEEIQDLRATFSQLQATTREITAPVALPGPEEMTVRLVTTNSLERLEEYRTEESKWFSWLGVFIGALLGIFVNLATGGQMKPETWIIAGTFLVIGGLMGGTAWSYRQRANHLKNQILGNKPNIGKAA